MCSNQRVKWIFQQEGSETNFLADIEYHITSEHWDTYSNEVEAEMRREVLARKRANYGVEDPVRWEEYYRTNCKLRRGPI